MENSEIEELLSGLYVDDGRSYQRKLYYGERYSHEERKFVRNDELMKKDIDEKIDRAELTRKEVLKAMNMVNPDLEFTMELCSDFKNDKLPTLSFALFTGENGLEHTYY